MVQFLFNSSLQIAATEYFSYTSMIRLNITVPPQFLHILINTTNCQLHFLKESIFYDLLIQNDHPPCTVSILPTPKVV